MKNILTLENFRSFISGTIFIVLGIFIFLVLNIIDTALAADYKTNDKVSAQDKTDQYVATLNNKEDEVTKKDKTDSGDISAGAIDDYYMLIYYE